MAVTDTFKSTSTEENKITTLIFLNFKNRFTQILTQQEHIGTKKVYLLNFQALQ